MQDFASADVTRMYREEYAQALNSLGRFNLAIFGKTGTGKSTLVNAIFGEDVAATGSGRPVTTGLDYYVHPSGVLGIYDSRGFETGEAGDRILAALEEIVATTRSYKPGEQIHVAWYTLRWSDRRFEDHQAAFVRRLSELGLPVLFVLTQVPCNREGEIHHEAVEFAQFIAGLGLPLAAGGRVFLTNAKDDAFLQTVVFGLQELLDATFDTIPEVAVSALSAAQQLDWGRKRQAAQKIIRASASSALATGATPIPFSDAAILVPLQVAMIARLTAAYGSRLASAQLASLVGSLMLSSGATTAGRWMVSSLLRVVPGGQPAAMVISGTVAASMTTAMGWAWVAVLERYLVRGDLSDVDSIRQAFVQEFRSRFKLTSRQAKELERGPGA
ncbi:MAG: DUF697 domain-containing protein [Candidatus Nanopelagicales bacterium]|jgi:uncharacterized protein (DUF697 family)/GTP-binding protein EngB required for normal cell division|nr:DUF697 domain-containing protein [Candidatus Nanopelagicales bacterium]